MKQESIVIDKKTTLHLKTGSERMTVAATVLIVGAAFASSICLFLFWNHALSPFLQVLVYLLAGMVHTYTLGNSSHTLSATGEWVYTLVTTAVILALFATAHLLGADFPLYLVVSSGCAFLFPFSVHDMWKANVQLALEDARVWQPTHEKEAAYPAFYFNNTPMRFRVLQGGGQPKVNLKFKVSNEMPLGKIYYDLVQNKTNKPETVIPLVNAHQKPYHWVFFTTDSIVLTRPLDPDKTLAENGLHENKIIYAQKVSSADISRLTQQN